ncbi:MAG: rod shape-determining protein MreD [Rhodospirillaceae bacterium]|jgi:rod shape-determining protein MreD|nr:rod shape-determining protein MreD [Rhodospirillaceae bacterium]
MRRTVWHRMDTLSRQFTPVLLTLVLVVLGVVALHAPGWARVAPLLSLLAVYHWAVYRPDLMPGYAVFAIGLLQDVLGGTPLGLFTLLYLVAYGVVVSQQRFLTGKAFFVVWLGFVLISAGVMALAWILLSAMSGGVIDPEALLYQYLLGVGLYPVLARLFLSWQQKILRPV